VTGDGRDDLVLLWHSTSQYPQLTQLVVLAPDERGRLAVLFDEYLSSRQEAVSQIAIVAAADLTHNDRADILLHDEATNQLYLLATTGDLPALIAVPERCTGNLAVLDTNDDGRLEIARDGCQAGRVIMGWNGRSFSQQ